MHVTINGKQQDIPVRIERGTDALEGEQLYVGNQRVIRVTHSRSDDMPVQLQVGEELLAEADPREFYALNGMHHDWQPGYSSQGITPS